MKKLKISVPSRDWGSFNTKYPPDSPLVEQNEIVLGSYNIDTDPNGSLRKRSGRSFYGCPIPEILASSSRIDFSYNGSVAADTGSIDGWVIYGLDTNPTSPFSLEDSDGNIWEMETTTSGGIGSLSLSTFRCKDTGPITPELPSELTVSNNAILGTYHGTPVSSHLHWNYTPHYDEYSNLIYTGTDYSPPGVIRDQYEAIFADGSRHLLVVANDKLFYTSGDGVFHQVASGYTQTANFEFTTYADRVYFGNGIVSKVYGKITSYGGVTYTFPTDTVKDAGAQAPASALTAALATDVTANQIPAGQHSYKVTYVYYEGEESEGSAKSNVVTNDATHTSNNLTSIPVGGYGVTGRNIYRDDNDNQYYLVGIIANNTATTFSDKLQTGVYPIPINNGIPPIFSNVINYLDRIFVFGPSDPFTMFYSEAGQPDIFPSENTFDCNQNDSLTAHVMFLGRMVIFSRYSMGQMLGRTPDQFAYEEIASSVGCIDCRSIQIRIIDGTPVLVWLSDKGLYAYNGNAISYISDKIQDQLDLNIQQSNLTTGKFINSSLPDFEQGSNPPDSAGVFEQGGVNIESAPGSLTSKGPYWDTSAHPGATYENQTDPHDSYENEEDFNLGDFDNVSGIGQDFLSIPTAFSPTADLYSSKDSNVITDVINGVSLTVISDGDLSVSESVDGTYIADTATKGVARYFDVVHPGTLSSIKIYFPFIRTSINSDGNVSYHIKVKTDSSGIPDAELYDTTHIVLTKAANTTDSGLTPSSETFSPGLSLLPGRYWITIESSENILFPVISIAGSLPSDRISYLSWLDGLWHPYADIWAVPYLQLSNSPYTWYFSNNYTKKVDNLPMDITFVQDSVSSSGSWISEIYDSKCSNVGKTLYLTGTGTYPTHTYNSGSKSTLSTMIIEGSNNAYDSSPSWNEIIRVTNFSDTDEEFTVTSTFRWFRINISLSSEDSRMTPTAASFKLSFTVSGEWVSDVIDTTTDAYSYDGFDLVSSVPAGTSVTKEIATSDSPTGAWSYVSFGSETVRRYVRIKIILNAASDDLSSPTITSVFFKWTVKAVYISAVIDAIAAPSGWGVFQGNYVSNGGTVNFYMRSATSSGGLSSATWYQVTNGNFPGTSLPVFRYAQYKAEIISQYGKVPIINGITVNWYKSTGGFKRVASLFWNRSYYLAASEENSEYNNIVYVLNYEGKWRIYRGLDTATMSLYFNSPFYGDSVDGKVYKFLDQESSDSVDIDFRSKSFDFSESEYDGHEEHIKLVEYAILIGKNTGATISCSFSLDGGESFIPLYDDKGLSSFTVGIDGKKFYKLLKPNYGSSMPAGRTVTFRIYNNDSNPVEIDQFKISAFVRKMPPVTTG